MDKATLLLRVRPLNAVFSARALPAARGPVIVVLERDLRLHDNWAVIYAQSVSRSLAVPLVVAFACEPTTGPATLRAWAFALRGVAEVQGACSALGIPFVLLHGPPNVVSKFARSENASLVVADFTPLRPGRAWRASVGEELARASPPIGACEVDAHNVVPVWIASDKLEYAA